MFLRDFHLPLPDYLRDPRRSFDSFRRNLKAFLLLFYQQALCIGWTLRKYVLHKSTVDTDIDTNRNWPVNNLSQQLSPRFSTGTGWKEKTKGSANPSSRVCTETVWQKIQA